MGDCIIKDIVDSIQKKPGLINRKEVQVFVDTLGSLSSDKSPFSEEKSNDVENSKTRSFTIEEFKKELNLNQEVDLKNDTVLQEIFKANRKVVQNLSKIGPTKVVVTSSVEGGKYSVSGNTVSLNPSRMFSRETIAHELIHSLQQKMRFEQLSTSSQQFVGDSIKEFKNLTHKVITKEEFLEIDQALKTQALEKVIKKYSREKLEYGYLAHIANGHYNSLDPISENQISNRFGREYTAIIGSSPLFRNSIYKATSENDKLRFKRVVKEVLDAIVHVKDLIKGIISEDNGRFNNDPTYRKGLQLLDEYLENVNEEGGKVNNTTFSSFDLDPFGSINDTITNLEKNIKSFKGCKQ